MQVAVFLKDIHIPHNVLPRQLFSDDAVYKLLKDHSMVIPFRDSMDERGLLTMVKDCLHHLNICLDEAFQLNECKGHFDASWKAYQMQLVLEELIYGHPLCQSDAQIAQSLWTSTS